MPLTKLSKELRQETKIQALGGGSQSGGTAAKQTTTGTESK